jgi:hypothetical protein
MSARYLSGLSLSVVLLAGSPAFSAPLASFLPKAGLGQFIVDKLELGSFGSLLGPRLMPSQHTFGGMKLTPKEVTADQVVFDHDDYYIQIAVLARGDFNRDGLEDVIVCWSDQVKGGTYRSSRPILLTRYSANTPLIAIAMPPAPQHDCEPYPPRSQR